MTWLIYHRLLKISIKVKKYLKLLTVEHVNALYSMSGGEE